VTAKETVPMERMSNNVPRDIAVVELFNVKIATVHHQLLFVMALMIVEMVQTRKTVRYRAQI
jgi:hypothetical protein